MFCVSQPVIISPAVSHDLTTSHESEIQSHVALLSGVVSLTETVLAHFQ